MGTQRICPVTQWDQELPAVVLEHIAALPRGRDQAKRALAHWSVWLQERYLGSLATAHGYNVWQQFLIDHTAIYAINDRGDYGLREWIEITLREKKLKPRGPLSFNEVKQRIRCLIEWQAQQQWNSAEDLRALFRLYQRFHANSRNSALLLKGFPESDVDTSNMLSVCGWISTGDRDTALISLTRLLSCSLDDLAQMKCCDVETDDWQNWSVRLPTRSHPMRIYLDPNTAYHLVCWLFERKWRPGLETPLFTGDYNAEPLTASHIQLIFERRYRVTQVLSLPYSRRAPRERDRELLFDDALNDASCQIFLSEVTGRLVDSIKDAERAEGLMRLVPAQEVKWRGRQAEQAAEHHWLSAPNEIERTREMRNKAIAELFYKPIQPVYEDALHTNTFNRRPSRAEMDDEEQYDWDAAVRTRAERGQRAELATGAVEQVDWEAAIIKLSSAARFKR